MVKDATHSVGLRQLRHETSGVLARVRAGETLDVTAHGRLVARLVPALDPASSPLSARLVEQGRLILPERPGYRPARRSSAYGNTVGEALRVLRAEETW